MPRGYVDTSLGQIHYVREGTGKPLVLLAASGRSSRMFARLVPLLAPHFAVYTPDTPGFGNSDPLKPGTTIEQLAECLLEVLDALGLERTLLYGLHTGNKIATSMAVRWPERIDHLVLGGQSHSLVPDRKKRNAAILAMVRDYLETPEHEIAAELAAWAASFQRLSAIWWERNLVASGAPPERRAFARNLALDEIQADGTAALYAANFAYDLGRDLARITVPTLILEITTPAEDSTIGRQGAVLQGLIPGAALRTIAEPHGHTLTLEDRARDLADILLANLGAVA